LPCALKPERYFRKVKIPKVSWVRVPLSMVSVARKLSTIEERIQDQSCLFRRGDYRSRDITPKICPGFDPGEIVSVAQLLSTIMHRNQQQNCLFRRGGFT
jgi:hypothetical protein